MTPIKLPAVQASPVKVPHACDGRPGLVKVDAAVTGDGRTIVAGWRLGDVEVELHADGSPLAAELLSFVRPDVAEQYELEPRVQAGFALVAKTAAHGGLCLVTSTSRSPGQRHPLVCSPVGDLPAEALAAIGPAASALLDGQPFPSKTWRRVIGQAPLAAACPGTVAGHIESAVYLQGTGQLVVLGWVAATPGVHVWLEDDAENMVGLDHAYRFHRRDVFTHLSGGPLFASAATAAFLVRLESERPAGRIRLMALGPQGRHLVSDFECGAMSPSVDATVRWLYGCNTPRDELDRRFSLIDRPLLDRITARNAALWATMPIRRIEHGAVPEKPRASLIVPLYGRFDFVESQMVEWVRDPAIGTRFELIYVVDDPDIVQAFTSEAASLYRLYGVPFRVVYGGVNRGFSGANNLGAAESRGDVLVFLNSDVFPRTPGWVDSLCATLERHADIGAVGPRLLFADGGIQHAGMRSEWLPEFGIWANLHPGVGLDPALDPAPGLTDVPAVTGACLAIRRSDFERVGGWDTGYLIGDFEDSDLCMKLRSCGLRVTYDPSVQLTHLERQSFTLRGDGEFRQQVVLLNAQRHQQRWARFLAKAEPAS